MHLVKSSQKPLNLDAKNEAEGIPGVVTCSDFLSSIGVSSNERILRDPGIWSTCPAVRKPSTPTRYETYSWHTSFP